MSAGNDNEPESQSGDHEWLIPPRSNFHLEHWWVLVVVALMGTGLVLQLANVRWLKHAGLSLLALGIVLALLPAGIVLLLNGVEKLFGTRVDSDW